MTFRITTTDRRKYGAIWLAASQCWRICRVRKGRVRPDQILTHVQPASVDGDNHLACLRPVLQDRGLGTVVRIARQGQFSEKSEIVSNK